MVDASYRHCFESATAAAGRSLSEDELNNLFGRVQGRMNRYVREGMTQRDAAMRAGAELGAEHRAAAVQARLGAAQNLQKRVAMRTWLAERAETDFKAKDGSPDLLRAVRASLEGLPHGEGAALSTAAVAKSRAKEYIGALDNELRSTGLLKAVRSGALDKDIRKEMYELSQRGDAGQFPGVSGNKAAQQVGEIFNRYLSLARERLNTQGAWIGHLADYVMKTNHDPIRIFKGGADGWIDHILPLLDQGRTFENAEPGTEREFLRQVWSSLSTGVHFTDTGSIGMKAPAFSGPGNMARRMSESRLLHFKDADSWGAYMDRFGTKGTMVEQMARTLKRASDQEALLRKWGTNPQAEFDSTLRWLKEKYTDGQEAAVIKFTAGEKTIRQLFDHLTGEVSRPQNQMAAEISQGLRNIASMSKLGNMVLSDLGNTVLSARELQRSGMPFLESYHNATMAWLGAFQGADAVMARDLLHASVEGVHASLAMPGWIDDTIPGTLSKLTNTFMRLTGSPSRVAWQKTMAAYGTARLLGRQADKGFADLLPETRGRLSDYGITPAEWDALRAAPDHQKNSLGNILMLPDAAARSGLSKEAADTLALKLATYYSDTGDRATITPNIGDRRALIGNTQPGTWDGELRRFIAQFKSWPMALGRQTMQQERGTAAFGGAIGGIMQLGVGLTLFGYLRDTLADTFQGKQPRSPKDPRTWMHALASGGSMGIFGDYLFGQANRFGGGITDTLAGPVIGQTVNDAVTFWNSLRDAAAATNSTERQAQLKAIPPELVRMARNNTPFVNLFYTRAAINYLFMSSLQEAMNPGYLRRSQQNLKKQTGQGYIDPHTPGLGWMNPTQHLHTFGR